MFFFYSFEGILAGTSFRGFRKNLKELYPRLLYLERTNKERTNTAAFYSVKRRTLYKKIFKDILHLQAGLQAKREITGETAD